MTKICIVIALCLRIVLQHSGAYAANFVEVYRSDKHLISIDVSSLKDHGDYVTVWEKCIYRERALEEEKKKYGENTAFIMDLVAYKVSDKEYQTLSWNNYSNDGKCLNSQNWYFAPERFKPIAPNTIVEYLWERVMALTNH